MAGVDNKHTPGRIVVVHGSMFAGKTEYVIARLHSARASGQRVMAFKHTIDDRYDPDHLVTHRLERFEAIRVPEAGAIPDLCARAAVVAIDEGHFFGCDLIQIAGLLRKRGQTVIVAGITNDAWGRPFEPIPQLARIADEEVLKQAPCRVCGEPAPYTQRMVAVDQRHMIGGLTEYEPRCAAHFTPLSGPPEQR